MHEDVFLMLQRLEFAAVVIRRRAACDVGDHAKIFIEHGDEAPAGFVFGPVVTEVGDVKVVLVKTNLPWVTTGKIGLRELPAIEREAQQMLLVTHSDEKSGIGSISVVCHATMRPPVDDAAFLSAKDLHELATRIVVRDEIAPVAVEDKEVAIREMQRPGRFVLLRLLVFAGVPGPSPFIEEVAIESGLDHAIRLQTGHEKDFALPFPDDGQAVRSWKSGAPFVDEPALPVIDDDVVRHVISKQNNVSLAILDDAVTIFYRGLAIENAPVRHDTKLMLTLAKNGSADSSNVWEANASGGGDGLKKAAVGGMHNDALYAGCGAYFRDFAAPPAFSAGVASMILLGAGSS